MNKTSEDVAWEKKRHLTIDLATDNDFEDVKQFVHDVFNADAPVSRCLEINKPNRGYFHDLLSNMFDEVIFTKAYRANKTTPSCLVARSTETGKIVGTRFGSIKTKTQARRVFHEDYEISQARFLSTLEND